MKNYILLCTAALAVGATAGEAAARAPKNNKIKLEFRQAAMTDSLRNLTSRQAAAIDSLQRLLCMSAPDAQAETACAASEPAVPVDPEQAAADSVAALKVRLQRKSIGSTFDSNGLTVIDTLSTDNEGVQVILYGNNSWKYVRNRAAVKDSTIFEKYWDTKTLFPYREVDMSSMPSSVLIDLIDSTATFHCPYVGKAHPHGKYGPRRRRQHHLCPYGPLRPGAGKLL